MNRLHALVVSVVLGAAGVAGAIAATKTMHLGQASAAPVQTDDTALRARARKLNAWAKALDGSLTKRPPALPQVPQFGPVAIPSYATAVPVAARTTAPTKGGKASRQTATSARAATNAPRSSSPTPGADSRRSKDDQPGEPPATTPPASAPTPTATPAAVPSPPPVPTEPPSTGGGDDDKGGGGEPPDPPEPSDDG